MFQHTRIGHLKAKALAVQLQKGGIQQQSADDDDDDDDDDHDDDGAGGDDNDDTGRIFANNRKSMCDHVFEAFRPVTSSEGWSRWMHRSLTLPWISEK